MASTQPGGVQIKTYSRKFTRSIKAAVSSNEAIIQRVFSPVRVFSDPDDQSSTLSSIENERHERRPTIKKNKAPVKATKAKRKDDVIELKLFKDDEVMPSKKKRGRGAIKKAKGVSDVSNTYNRNTKAQKQGPGKLLAEDTSRQTEDKLIAPDLENLLIESSQKIQNRNFSAKVSKNCNSDIDQPTGSVVVTRISRKDKTKNHRSSSKHPSLAQNVVTANIKRFKACSNGAALSEAEVLGNVNRSPDPKTKVDFLKSWLDHTMDSMVAEVDAEESTQEMTPVEKPSQEWNDNVSSQCSSVHFSQPRNTFGGFVSDCSNLEGTPSKFRNVSAESINRSSSWVSTASTVASLKGINKGTIQQNIDRIRTVANTSLSSSCPHSGADLPDIPRNSRKLQEKMCSKKTFRLTPKPQNVLKKSSTASGQNIDRLFSSLMHGAIKPTRQQLDTSNLVYLKRPAKRRKSRRSSCCSSGKETSSAWRTADTSRGTNIESTRFTGDVTSDLMTVDLINTASCGTGTRVTRSVKDTIDGYSTGITVNTTDLIEGATADLMTEDFTHKNASSSTEPEVFRHAEAISDSFQGVERHFEDNQLIIQDNVKKAPNKVISKLIDLDFTKDRSDKPDFDRGTPELVQETGPFESMPSPLNIDMKVVKSMMCSTFLPDKDGNETGTVDVSPILWDSTRLTEDVTGDLMTDDLTKTGAQITRNKKDTNNGCSTRVTVGTTELIKGATADKMTEDFSSQNVSSLTKLTSSLGDEGFGVATKEGQTTDLISLSNQKKKTLNVKMSSTVLPGKAIARVVIDESTIPKVSSCDVTQSETTAEFESPSLKEPGRVINAKMSSTVLPGKEIANGVVMNESTIPKNSSCDVIQSETTPEFESPSLKEPGSVINAKMSSTVLPGKEIANGDVINESTIAKDSSCDVIQSETTAEFESPSLKEPGSVINAKMSSTVLPGKEIANGDVINESTIAKVSSCDVTQSEITAEFECRILKEPGRVINAKMSSTVLPGKEITDGVVMNESTIAKGETCHDETEREPTIDFIGHTIQKESRKAVKAKMSSTVLPGKVVAERVVIDLSTIEGDHSGYLQSGSESYPEKPVKIVKAKMSSTVLPGRKAEDKGVMDISTIYGDTCNSRETIGEHYSEMPMLSTGTSKTPDMIVGTDMSSVHVLSTIPPGTQKDGKGGADTHTYQADNRTSGVSVEEPTTKFLCLPSKKRPEKYAKGSTTSGKNVGIKNAYPIYKDVRVPIKNIRRRYVKKNKRPLAVLPNNRCFGGNDVNCGEPVTVEDLIAEVIHLHVQKQQGMANLPADLMMSHEYDDSFTSKMDDSMEFRIVSPDPVPKRNVRKMKTGKPVSSALPAKTAARNIEEVAGSDWSLVQDFERGSMQQLSETTPVRVSRRGTPSVASSPRKLRKELHPKKQGKLHPKNSTMLFPNKAGTLRRIDDSDINCSAIETNRSGLQHGLQCNSNTNLLNQTDLPSSINATKNKTNLKKQNSKSVSSTEKSVHFQLPDEPSRKRKIYTSTPSNSIQMGNKSSLIGLSSIAADLSYSDGEMPPNPSTREVITDEIINPSFSELFKEALDAVHDQTSSCLQIKKYPPQKQKRLKR